MNMKRTNCVFCESELEIVMESNQSLAFYDRFPVSKGHVLIIPKKHFETYFDVPQDIREDMLLILDKVKLMLDSKYQPSGYNIGINSGASAGQTVFHCHIHLIPRYDGDMEDPRGGVRGVKPDKQKY